MTGAARVHVFRLHRGEDLRGGIEAYAAQHGIGAAAVASCAAACHAFAYAVQTAQPCTKGKDGLKSCR